MKVTQQRISINNVNEINKEVIDVAFGNGCNAASRVVIPRNPHNKCDINIVREIKKQSLNILGLSEVKWKKSGDCYFEGYCFISVGGGRGEHGLAIILDQEMARRVVNIEQENLEGKENVGIDEMGS